MTRYVWNHLAGEENVNPLGAQQPPMGGAR